MISHLLVNEEAMIRISLLCAELFFSGVSYSANSQDFFHGDLSRDAKKDIDTLMSCSSFPSQYVPYIDGESVEEAEKKFQLTRKRWENFSTSQKKEFIDEVEQRWGSWLLSDLYEGLKHTTNFNLFWDPESESKTITIIDFGNAGRKTKTEPQ